MAAGRLYIDRDQSPEQALAHGAALSALVSEAAPVALYGAPLRGDALVLGRHQLASQLLSPDRAATALRRCTGGALVHAADGVSYVALALYDRSSLMACPPGRLLNRNVRGVLQGLRLAGVPANYFGRDFLSFAARPAIYVGWDASDDGRALLEFFVSHARSCFVPDDELRYPPRAEPSLRGQAPTTLAESGHDLPDLFDKIAAGHSKAFGVIWERAAVPAHQPLEMQGPDPALTWSSPREEAIGFVSAGVALDHAGKFAAVRLAGDFFAHRGCGATLERVLLGVTPAGEPVARAVDAAFAHAGHDVEGIRKLHSFQDAILDAADAAARGAA
jgi:hypothetical protein